MGKLAGRSSPAGCACLGASNSAKLDGLISCNGSAIVPPEAIEANSGPAAKQISFSADSNSNEFVLLPRTAAEFGRLVAADFLSCAIDSGPSQSGTFHSATASMPKSPTFFLNLTVVTLIRRPCRDRLRPVRLAGTRWSRRRTGLAVLGWALLGLTGLTGCQSRYQPADWSPKAGTARARPHSDAGGTLPNRGSTLPSRGTSTLPRRESDGTTLPQRDSLRTIPTRDRTWRNDNSSGTLPRR